MLSMKAGESPRLLAICVATGSREIRHKGRTEQTGIYKQPVNGVHRVTSLGLEGDCQMDLENHGGEDKAIYVYTAENHAFWERELGQCLPFGQWGENFSVIGLPDETVCIGDVFAVGSLRLQVTQPRVPCFKLGVKMGDPGFVGRFHHSGRVGFYLRVLESGTVSAPMDIHVLDHDPAGLSIQEAMLALSPGPRQKEIIVRALALPALSAAWRKSLTKRQASL
jgi:MOSC domain-containing protein YiiM